MALRDTEDIAQRALKLGLIGPVKRQQLLDGLPMGFVYSLPTVSRPMDQLRFDLMELSRTPRLIGLSSPPMAVWLRNAATLANSLHHQGAKQDALFFDQRAAALDGQPVVITIDQSTHTDNSTHVRNVDNSVKTDNSTRIGDVGGNAIMGDSNTVTVNHYYGGSDREAARSPQPEHRRAPSAEPPTPAERAPAPDDTPTELTDKPVVVLALGIGEREARQIVGKRAAITGVIHIEVQRDTWARPPTDGSWRAIAQRINRSLERALRQPGAPGLVVVAPDAPAAMLAWVVRVAHSVRPPLELFVADPPQYSADGRWQLASPARGAVKAKDELIDVQLQGPPGAKALAVYLDLGILGGWRSPGVAGCDNQATLRVNDPNWDDGEVPVARLSRPLTRALRTLARDARGAQWHVFYDGPPSLWCAAVLQTLRTRLPMIVYAADLDRKEHVALTLPHGTWAQPPESQRDERRYDVFLAYPEAGRAVATAFHERLPDSEYAIFFDKKSLIPGEVWVDAKPRAQRNSLITAVVVTGEELSDFFHRDEIVAAIALARDPKSCQRVVPIIVGEVDPATMPSGLSILTPIELPDGLVDGKAVRQLIEVIDVARRARAKKADET